MQKQIAAVSARVGLWLAIATLAFGGGTAKAVTTESVIEGYRILSTALAADRFSQTRDLATRLVPTLETWIAEHPAPDAQAPHAAKMLEGTRQLAATSDEEPQRLAFSTFSQGATGFIKRDSTQAQWQLYFCPMAQGFAYWAQLKTEKMANPYMGLKMLQCGVKKAWSVLP